MKAQKTIEMKKTILFLLFPFYLTAQEGTTPVHNTFDDTRIINGHSVETSEEGQMKFIIGHRFGRVDGGINELYGLDQSTIRLGFDYGVTDRVTVGIGRSSFEKTLDGYSKINLLQQKEDNGSPISLTWLSTANYKTLENLDPNREDLGRVRWDYVNQALIARKFSDFFSLQIMPTHLHKNLVASKDDANDIFAIGAATRMQISKTVSFKTEYYYALPDQLPDDRTNSLSVGFDIETKHHVFQLHLSNSAGMTEKFFVGETFNQWENGEFMFGFNITRDFQIKGRKYK